ncbi:MAG: M28 family peptidase [Daejeonella sp.]|uniref:M28 family peptidase n=1 Tax=Daejeonella sp. TaxID=2805397 RepID=UPI002736887F|nr:M28 family peptidase [Daejeonella sp.]MDP3469511.1 M28 family peptidase [Daejeonella sp.]
MKRQLTSFILSAVISIQCFAQDPAAQKFAAEITAKRTKKHLKVLASDKYEGRETGKRGAEMAAAYLAREFKKLKLTAPVKGSYLQDVELIETSIIVNSLEVNGKKLQYLTDFTFSGSGEAKIINTDEIIFIGSGTESDLKNTTIADKVVLLKQEGETAEINKRLNFIKNKKPTLIIAVNFDTTKPQHSHLAGASLSVKNGIRESVPMRANTPGVIQIGSEIADKILSRSGKTFGELNADNGSQLIKADVKLNYEPVKRGLKSSNVLGFLEGTDLKDELLVYSAHYDHIGMNPDGGKDKVFNGADDDASGTSGVLAIARAFAKAKNDGNGPRRSILFLMFTGEEKNLLGSEYYALNPVFPFAKTITNLNVDMIGRIGTDYLNSPDSSNYCFLVGADRLSTDLYKISENANAIYTKLKIDYKHNAPDDQIYYWSDHYNFAKNGVPVIFYYNGKHDDYHKGSDEISKINFELLAKRAQLAYYTGWDLVMRDKRPVVDVKD